MKQHLQHVGLVPAHPPRATGQARDGSHLVNLQQAEEYHKLAQQDYLHVLLKAVSIHFKVPVIKHLDMI